MLDSTKLLLQQVRVLNPLAGSDRIADVAIADGQIEAIETHLEISSQDTTVIDARGLILAPGLVDLYSHSGEPGHEERETLASLANAAIAGGFTRIAILPNTIPPVDNPATLALLQQKEEGKADGRWQRAEGIRRHQALGTRHEEGGNKEEGQEFDLSPHTPPPRVPASPPHPLTLSPNLYFWGALTLGLEGQQMTEVVDLAKAGAIGFADGRPVKNLGLLRRLLEYVKPLNKPVALVPVSESLRGNGVMREGSASIAYGLPGDPAISETVAIASLLELIAAVGTPVHLMRISTRRGVELIAEAKARGVPVTASTTWMHLLLNAEDVASYDPCLRLDPPLGNREDMKALIEGTKQGIIDAIAIDHTPYTYEEKTLAFAEAPPGTIGFELALPLLWNRLVENGDWTALELWQALSVRPQMCFHQQPITCMPGQPAELVLFDPNTTWTANGQTLRSLSSNTPWLGKEITGRVSMVIS